MDGDFQYYLARAIQLETLDGSIFWIAYLIPGAMHSSISVDLLDKSGYVNESFLIRIPGLRGFFDSYLYRVRR